MSRYGSRIIDPALLTQRHRSSSGRLQNELATQRNAVIDTTSTFDLSYFDVNLDKFGKLWKKREITSENQNDAQKKTQT